jgi:autotransporter-associated beta strand protein
MRRRGWPAHLETGATVRCSASPTAQPLVQQTAREILCAPLHARAGLRCAAFALATAALAVPFEWARAACTPTLTPTAGQTVTCDSNQPNPVTTGIVAQPGSANVTINMLSGAQLNVSGGDAVVLGGGGLINNISGAIIQGVRGINGSGPLDIENAGQITGTGGPGVLLNGAGTSVLNNTGTINGSGGVAVQFNTVAGSTNTFNNTGNGSINGNFVGSGDGTITIVQGGNFNGGITITGNGINSITTQTGRNINGQVSISGNSQNTIVNGGAFNNGLVISGAGVNNITNQSGAFINQTFSVSGSQNTIDNAGTLNNGLTVGNGINNITNRGGAFINQTFSVTGTQNTINNSGTLNNGVTVSGSGTNSITNGSTGVINQTLTVTGNPTSTVTNFGTVNATINMSGTGGVFNEGAINGSGGTAINFTSGPGPFTLTLAPASTINGNVLGTGSDTFQLGSSLIGGSNTGTFNVSNIGPAQQYRGFSTFNKIGPSSWTLTGTGAQNWNISGGVLIGDTNSLQGPAITNNAALVFNQSFGGTYAGSIGGSGAVTVQGGGTVTFTGSNTYTGGTTITGATLQLGDPSGSIVGDVVNNGTFTINRSSTFTFDGMISGSGSFVQQGAGTTILTGNNGYSGATTVNAGTLQVSGSIAGSSGVTVNAGATLAGTGTVTGRVGPTTINTGGTLAPGNNAVGNLVVAGDLLLQNGANYLVQVTPTSAGNTFVTGSTTITAGATLTANDLGGNYNVSQTFPVLSSTGPLSGTFTLVKTGAGFIGASSVTLEYSPHEVFLVINAGGGGPPTWKMVAGSSDWNTGTNWTTNTVPTATEIAQFTTSSNHQTIDIQQANTQVGGLQFNTGAPAYTFNVTGTGSGASSLIVLGSGVADISGNAPTFVVSGIAGALGTLEFQNSATADDAIIHTLAFGQTIFSGTSNGGLARFITEAGGLVDFSGTSGPGSNNRVSAGSIEGAGTYNLGANALIVGLNNLSTTVSGTINGAGGSLIKVGDGTLILSGNNTYTGLTAVLGGALQLGDGGTSGSIPGNVFVHTTFAINRSDTYTFGGLIVGDGAFVQMGPGTTILTANNLYFGGTTISAGTLQLGNGGTSGSIIGDVVNNGTLAINRSDTYTFGGVISGTGGFAQLGSGTTILTAANTYFGGTSVNSGMLVVNGSIANSVVTVNAGGTLAGTGTVGAAIINGGGTLAPGSGAPGSTMTVAGNLAFQSGALYLVQIDPSSASSVNVTGTATLTGGSVQAVFTPGSYAARQYTILHAGGLNGTFSGVSSNVPVGFTESLSYTSTDVILNLTAALGVGGNGSLSGNQQNVANALNNFFNSGGTLPPAFVAIFGLTGANLGNALSQLSGEAATGAQQAGFMMTNQFLGLMLDPFVDGRSGIAGTRGPALGFAPERDALPRDIALAYSSVLKAPMMRSPSFEQRWSVWGSAYGGSNRTSGDPVVMGSHDLSASAAGFAGGLDYRVTPNSVVGMALAGGGTSWSLAQGLGGGRSDALQAGVYGAMRAGPTYLAAALAYTNHWMSTDRFAFAGDHLTASFDARSLGARVE